MSKAFLKSLIKDKANNNFFFSSCKREWARKSAQQAMDNVWSKNINPSAKWLTFDGCPYEGVREASKPRQAYEAWTIQYFEVGNYLHAMFQDLALTLPDLLYPMETFLDKEGIDPEKLKKHWPEVPLFWEKYRVSLRADLIFLKNGECVVADFKIPQRTDAGWEAYLKTLPEETHVTQAAIGALALKRLGILDPKYVAVLYFNPCCDPKKGAGFKECYLPFNKEMEDKTELLLEHTYRELTRLLEGQESSCEYPLCKKHNKEK